MLCTLGSFIHSLDIQIKNLILSQVSIYSFSRSNFSDIFIGKCLVLCKYSARKGQIKVQRIFIFYLLFVFVLFGAIAGGTRGSLLAMLWRPSRMPDIKPKLAACNANTLPAVLSLCSFYLHFTLLLALGE